MKKTKQKRRKINMATLDMRDYHGLSESYSEDPNEGMGGGSD